MPIRFVRGWTALLVAPALALLNIMSNAVASIRAVVDELFPAPRLALDGGAFGPSLAITGHGVDPAVQQGLRHEAGLFRRAAARKV